MSLIRIDARPDFALQSTDFRMEVSCSAAFNHINSYMHPRATLIDASGREEAYFLKGVNDRAISLRTTIIELPENTDSLVWITLLDSISLSCKYGSSPLKRLLIISSLE